MIRRNLMFLSAPYCRIMPCCAGPAATNASGFNARSAGGAAGSDLVVLRVAGEPITERQVIAVSVLLAQQKQSPARHAQERNVNLFRGAVDNIIIEALLRNEASRLNLSTRPGEGGATMAADGEEFPFAGGFSKSFGGPGPHGCTIAEKYRENMKMQQVLDLALKDVPPATDAEVQKFYDDNLKKMTRPEQVHAAHILLLVDKNSHAGARGGDQKKLEGIRAEIESKSITFSDAAVKYSQDSGNAKQGGDLQYFTRGQMVPPFEEAAFGAEPGSLSQVVETQFGFHLIHVIDKGAAGKIPFEEAKADIKDMLDASSQRKVVQQYLKDLKTKSTIENFMAAEEFIKRHMASP